MPAHLLRAYKQLTSNRTCTSGHGKDHSHHVVRLRRDGTSTQEHVTIADLVRGTSIHARDFVSLALTSPIRGSPPLILPRGDAIIVNLAHIKAVVKSEWMLVFNASHEGVVAWVKSLASILREIPEYSADDPHASSFELIVLEEALREVWETYEQRMRLYRLLGHSLLSDGTDLLLNQGALRRRLILKDSVSNFELAVSDLLKVLENLIRDDEDMNGLLLSARDDALVRGESVDLDAHEGVELLLENYHRQITLTLHEAVSLQRLVQSRQELASLSLDLYRNRLVRMNVNIGIGTIGLGMITAIAGFFGMNLEIPPGIEKSPNAFLVVCACSAMLGGLSMGACIAYLSGVMHRMGAQREMQEVNVLQTIFRDLGRVDYVLKCASHTQDNLNRAEFRQLVTKALVDGQSAGTVSGLEADALFDLLDVSHDGLLQASEFKVPRLVKEAIASSREVRALGAQVLQRCGKPLVATAARSLG